MKNSSIVSAIVGGTFFAIPYLGLSVALPGSLVIGAVAFGASELLFRETKKTLKTTDINLYDILQDAKYQNAEIYRMISKVEKGDLQSDVREITETTKKIIATVEAKPEKYKKVDTFFDYYLPVTLKILEKYDEIENQKLSSSESAKFMRQTEKMIKEINVAFKKQLSNMYQSEIVDTDAEMKVFENMLKSDGFSDDDIKVDNKND